MPRVKVINDAHEIKCQHGSWLDHWNQFSGLSKAEYCSEVTCVNKDIVGAHVQKLDSEDKGWYVIPLCTKHKNIDKPIEVIGNSNMVHAYIQHMAIDY